jgi:hypothetical protein
MMSAQPVHHLRHPRHHLGDEGHQLLVLEVALGHLIVERVRRQRLGCVLLFLFAPLFEI